MDPDRVSVVYDIRRRLRRGHSEDVFDQFLTLGGYSALAALITFILHLVMARFLGPADYASYGTYVSILFTAFFMLTSIHLIISRFVAYHRTRHQDEQINYIVTHALRVLFPIGFIIFLVCLFFAEPISNFFNLTSITPTITLGFVLWFTVLVPVFEGAFKGMQDFRALGNFRITEAILRLVVVLGLVLVGFSVAGAIFGLGIGTFVALAFSYRHIRQIQKIKMMEPDLRQIKRFAIPVFIAMASLALLLNLDIILVKHYFPATEAGVFAAASLIAKIPFLVSMVFVGVMFPKITQLHSDGKNSVPVLRNALNVIAPLVAVFTLLSLFFAKPLFLLLFGADYIMGAAIGFYVFGMGCLAITVLLTVYLLAVRQDRIAYYLPLFLLALLLLLVWLHSSILVIMIVVMLVMAGLCAFALYQARNVLEFDYFI